MVDSQSSQPSSGERLNQRVVFYTYACVSSAQGSSAGNYMEDAQIDRKVKRHIICARLASALQGISRAKTSSGPTGRLNLYIFSNKI